MHILILVYADIRAEILENFENFQPEELILG